MTDYFNKLLEGCNSVKNEIAKSVIYDAMVKYADEYHVGYVCYDMDMYVALYECAITSPQRKHALEHIHSIIDDDSFQGHDELVENFRQFIRMKDFLQEEDKAEFDILCIMELDFFKRQWEFAKDLAKCGQADFYPDVKISEIKNMLKEVAELIISTGMSDLESYKEAKSQLLKLGTISRGYFSRLF